MRYEAACLLALRSSTSPGDFQRASQVGFAQDLSPPPSSCQPLVFASAICNRLGNSARVLPFGAAFPASATPCAAGGISPSELPPRPYLLLGIDGSDKDQLASSPSRPSSPSSGTPYISSYCEGLQRAVVVPSSLSCSTCMVLCTLGPHRRPHLQTKDILAVRAIIKSLSRLMGIHSDPVRLCQATQRYGRGSISSSSRAKLQHIDVPCYRPVAR